MGREETLNEKTVIGVAKTKLDGRILYLDILYGNRVILPDGTVSAIEPVIYDRILDEYLKRTVDEPNAPAPAPEEGKEEPEEQNWFRTEEDYGIKEQPLTGEQEEKARRLREDRNSFFFRGGEDGGLPEEAEPEDPAEEDREDDSEQADEALLAADGDEDIPFTRLLDTGRGGGRNGLMWALLAVIALLCLLLVLKGTGVI